MNKLPLSNIDNLSYHVIDIIKLAEDNKYTVIPTSKLKTNIDYFSYANFNKYEENSTSTEKTKQGLTLDLGIFKIGSDNTMTESFTRNYIYQNNMVYGELNVNYLGYRYDLQTSNSTLYEIRKNYVNKLFLQDLYNYSIYETLHSYGSHVLTSFYGGGRLTLLYAGKQHSDHSDDVKESEMESAINASFKISSNDINIGSIDVNQGIGGKYSNKTTINRLFSELKVFVDADGGVPNGIIVGSAQKIDNIEFSMGDWLKSLADQKLHVLSAINNNGLVPITEFIEEENYKANIKKLIYGLSKNIEYYDIGLRVPYITLMYYYP